MAILLTGVAGFIGAACARRLLDRGEEVVGADNLNDYYDVSLKEARLRTLSNAKGFRFERGDLTDRAYTSRLFESHRPKRVLHLAAQAGVRYSVTHPHAYTASNVEAFLNILEGCRHHGVEHLAFASSSSVYGSNRKLPFSVSDRVDHPVSLYAATKKAGELMAHCYSHLYGTPITALRYFTAYGPWGRPDMAYFLFTRKILAGEPIEIFNHGKHRRDFTYIDDVADISLKALDQTATPQAPGEPAFRIYNLGNGNPVTLTDFLATLEELLGRKAERRLVDIQSGDVEETHADITELTRDFGVRPRIALRDGLERFVRWYREYYRG